MMGGQRAKNFLSGEHKFDPDQLEVDVYCQYNSYDTLKIVCSKTNTGPVTPIIISGCPASSPNNIPQRHVAKITSETPSQPSVFLSRILPKAIFGAKTEK